MYLSNYLKLKLKKLLRMLSIPKGLLVLDVGSGNAPFPRADILCDRYFYDTDRVGHIVIDRPFVAADITALPFKDKSIDFIYCSHVLEHTDNPELAVKELCRVGKSGYIEVPSEFQEKVQSTAVHKWYVALKTSHKGGKIYLEFRRKERKIFDDTLQNSFRQLIDSRDKEYFSFFFAHNYDLFNIEYYWKDVIDIEVKEEYLSPNESTDQGYSLQRQVPLEEIYAMIGADSNKDNLKDPRTLIKKLIRKIYTGSNPVNLENILACPICKKNQLVKNEREKYFLCQICNKKYPIVRGNIPIMLVEHTR